MAIWTDQVENMNSNGPFFFKIDDNFFFLIDNTYKLIIEDGSSVGWVDQIES